LDAEKANAQKSKVMNTMKSIVFAPVALTSSLLGAKRQNTESLLDNAEDIEPVKEEKDDTATYGVDDGSMNSLVSLELGIHLIHTNKESLGRILVMTANTDISRLRPSVQKVFIHLLKALGERHLKPAFLEANERLSKSAPLDFQEGHKMVNMESLQFFDLIHMGDLIQQMVDVYYNEDIVFFVNAANVDR
jgi:recyclin-1